MENEQIIQLIALLIILGLSITILIKVDHNSKGQKPKSTNKLGNGNGNRGGNSSYAPPPCRPHKVDSKGTISDCVDTAGFNDFNCKCCDSDRDTGLPMTYFQGSGGAYCLAKGDPQCPMMCKLEVCQKDEGGIDQNCVAACVQNC
jgi:hypothetical protein